MIISVIMTILNRSDDIEIVIDRLLNQTLSKDMYEIIIADNGSTDKTREIIEKYKDRINLIDASAYNGSPYSARNMAAKLARGEFLLFLDGYADYNLLESFNNFLNENKCKVVTGKVLINPNKDDIYEIYDSIFSLDTERFSANGFSPTANLIIEKSLFDSMEGFKNDIRSGGDFILTKKISKLGYKIFYCDTAVSFYFARGRNELLKKIYRVSNGLPTVWKECGLGTLPILKSIIRPFVPINPLSFKKYILRRYDGELSEADMFRLYFIRYRINIIISYCSLKRKIMDYLMA